VAITCPNLDDLLMRLPSSGVVTTNGCFELLHVGHTRYLEAAKAEGDCLVVLVNTDASMARLKPDRELLVPQEERMEIVAALASVDFVVPLAGDRPTSMLAQIRPAVHVKGTDYEADELPEREVVERHGGRIAIVGPPKEWSSTELRQRLAGG
jgi:rfaE bifunctional protein nucleotidyltransferase chain/domain